MKGRAFSSEVETGSRQENASNQESRAPFRFIETEKGSSLAWTLTVAFAAGVLAQAGYLR
jgi:hypothetical protein